MDAPDRKAMRMVLALLLVLAVGGQAACGSSTANGTGEDCGRTPTAAQPRDPRAGPQGAPGSASIPAGSAPPAAAAPTSAPPPVPTPVDGRVTLTAANTGQTVVVPAGTLIDVRLEPVSGSVWTVPDSSDPQALPRLSASGACEEVKLATFRAVSDGRIGAHRPHGGAEVRLNVTVRVVG